MQQLNSEPKPFLELSESGKMNEQIILEVEKLSDADLRANLITLDFRGKEFKNLCLEELIRRIESYKLENI